MVGYRAGYACRRVTGMGIREDMRRIERRRAIQQFDDSVDQVLNEFRGGPFDPSTKGSVPFDTGQLRLSFLDRSRSVTGTRLTVIVSVNATSPKGFEYPGFLERSAKLGARRSRRLADGSMSIASPGSDNYWKGWWTKFWDGTNRWEQALRANDREA